MKYLLIVCLLLATSSASANNSCIKPFLNFSPKVKYTHEELELQIGKQLSEIEKAMNSVQKTNDIKLQAKLVEQYYHLIMNKLDLRLRQFKSAMAESPTPVELTAEALQEKMQQILYQEIKLVDYLTSQTQRMLHEKGIASKIMETFDESGNSYRYIEIISEKEQKLSRISQKIDLFKSKTNVDILTIDYYINLARGSGGFSTKTKDGLNQIDIGISGFKNLVKDDLILLVAKHEFKHAGFRKARALNIDSVFHASYFARGEKALSKHFPLYSRYMSAEELYNYVNNPLWGAKRLQNPQAYDPEDIFYDIMTINSYMQSTEAIARQTHQVSSRFSGLLWFKKNYGAKYSIDIYDKNLVRTSDPEKAFHLVVHDQENSYILADFITDKMRPVIKKVLEKEFEVILKVGQKNAHITRGNITPQVQQELQKEYLELLQREAKDEYIQLSKHLRKKQTELKKISNAIIKLNKEVLLEQEKLINAVKAKHIIEGGDLSFLHSELWVKHLQKMAQIYRKLGNRMRERHKSYLGNQK